MKKCRIKELLLMLPLVIAYILTKYAQYNPDWTEQISSLRVYPILSTIVGFLPSKFSFSLAELIVIIVLIISVIYIIFNLHKFLVSKGSRRAIVCRGIMLFAIIFSSIYFLFTILCGLNYYRYTFTTYINYDIEEVNVDELEYLCFSLANELVSVRAELDGNIYVLDPKDFEFYANESVMNMQSLSGKYPVLYRNFYSAPKPIYMSKIMSYSGITGMFFPFTTEANVNVDVPFFSIPATMVHELAHQCGFMREDEANFIAYLGCKESDNMLVQYSGLYLAFSYSINELKKIDENLADKVLDSLSTEVLEDMAYSREYWSQHRGIISSVSSSINNTYLKANNQNDGVYSYNRMVQLLLAEQRVKLEENSTR